MLIVLFEVILVVAVAGVPQASARPAESGEVCPPAPVAAPTIPA